MKPAVRVWSASQRSVRLRLAPDHPSSSVPEAVDRRFGGVVPPQNGSITTPAAAEGSSSVTQGRASTGAQ
jgi:hypothetical protein